MPLLQYPWMALKSSVAALRMASAANAASSSLASAAAASTRCSRRMAPRSVHLRPCSAAARFALRTAIAIRQATTKRMKIPT